MSLLRSTAVVAALTATSRMLGLVREMFQSRLIGAGVEQSAFAVAFAIPNMARRMFGEGALTAAFVPIFRSELDADASLVRAQRLARAVLTMSLLMLVSGVVLAWVLISVLLHLQLGSGFLPLKWELALRNVRILIPYMLFICGAAFGMGVLNSFGRFAAAALMPSLLNLGWIAALATLCFFPGLAIQTRVSWICGAILVAGVAQMAFMFRAMAQHGISPWPSFVGWRDENTRRVWRNMAIGCAGAGAVQINYMLDQVLALKASDWAAGAIGYADRLMELPLGIVGTAFGTVLLPTFSGYFSKNDRMGARTAFVSSVRNMMLFVLPAACALVVLAPELTRLIYRGGCFDELAVLRVSRAVACYSLGLGFFCLQKTLTPWFQAQQDLRTPLKVAVRMVFLNAFLNVLAVFCLPEAWRHVGLAASTVLCSGLSCLYLAYVAMARGNSFGGRSLIHPISRIMYACGVMVGVLWVLKCVLSAWTLRGPLWGVGVMAVFVVLGSVAYFSTLFLIGRNMLLETIQDFRDRRH